MRTRLTIIILVGIAALLLLARGCPQEASRQASKATIKRSSDRGDTSEAASDSQTKTTALTPFEAFMSVIHTPVVFYGRVLDNEGNPIPDADVSVSVSDKLGGDGTKLSMKSDLNGNFTVKTQGMSIYVKVNKDGYHRFLPREGEVRFSEGGFDYGEDFGKGVHRPDEAARVIFTLQKATPQIDLISVPLRTFPVARNGLAKVIPLQTSAGKHSGRNIVLRCWTHDERKQPDGRYDWRMEVSVQQGQLQPRTDEFDFAAPLNGYANVQTVDMPASLPKAEWHDDVDRLYWVRFDDGVFARLKVGMVAGGDHFALVEGYINPQSGSRNLDAPPKR